MRSVSLVWLCLLLIGGSVRGQQPASGVTLRLTRPQRINSEAGATLQAKVIDLLKTSNFNSKDHPGVFADGVRGVQRRYRDAVGGQYLVVSFAESRQFELIRGEVTAIEVVVGLNHPQYADALFTIDDHGTIVEHSKFSGKIAIEMLELAAKTGKGG